MTCSPPRVLYVATVSSHIWNFHRPYLRSLTDLGYEVWVAAGLDRSTLTLAKEVHQFVPLPFSRTPLHPGNLIAFCQLIRLLKRQKFVLCHVHTPVGAALGRMACSLTGTAPVVYTVHGFHFYKGAPWWHWLFYATAESALARWTDALITLNDEDFAFAQGLHLRGAQEPLLLPGVGLRADFLSPGHANPDIRGELGIPREAPLLVAVGELNANKSQEVLIRAMTRLREQFPDVHLVLVGEGSLETELKRLVHTLDLRDTVSFTGWRDDVALMLRASDLVVSASEREGFPLSLVEAMALGKAAVVTNVRGNRDVVQDGVTGVLVPRGDPEALARAVADLLREPQRRQEMGRTGASRADELSADRIVPKVLELYKKVLNWESPVE